MNNFLIRFFKTSARLFFALTILSMPLRFRLVVWTRPFFPVYSDYTDFLLFANDLALSFTLVFWACSLIVEPRKVRVGNPFVWFLLACLTIAGWVSAFGSVDAILTRYHAVRFVVLLFFYLYIVNEITSAAWVLIPAALQGLTQAFVAIGQSFSQASLGLQRLGEHVLNPLVLGTSIIPVNGERFLRAYGLADHPNILGGCLTLVLVLLLTAVLYGRQRQPIFAASVFMVIFPALLLTFSRSAWVSLFVAASFMVVCEALARRWDSLKRLILLGILSLAVSVPVFLNDLSVFGQRVNSGNVAEDHPMNERAYLLEAGNALFVEHSAIGVGLGASPLAMKLRFENFRVNYQPPHFTPLISALETGVIGGGFYLLLFITPALTFLLRWRHYIESPLALGAFSLLFAISVVNLFDYYTWLYAPGRLWQWLAWGLYSAVLSGDEALEQAG
ncbi:MAG: O-antigen ligase family protein [Chloroflexi bacterium]|nr:O-antigen ligase family protein [Chloroflexota bacterium]